MPAQPPPRPMPPNPRVPSTPRRMPPVSRTAKVVTNSVMLFPVVFLAPLQLDNSFLYFSYILFHTQQKTAV